MKFYIVFALFCLLILTNSIKIKSIFNDYATNNLPADSKDRYGRVNYGSFGALFYTVDEHGSIPISSYQLELHRVKNPTLKPILLKLSLIYMEEALKIRLGGCHNYDNESTKKDFEHSIYTTFKNRYRTNLNLLNTNRGLVLDEMINSILKEFCNGQLISQSHFF